VQRTSAGEALFVAVPVALHAESNTSFVRGFWRIYVGPCPVVEAPATPDEKSNLIGQQLELLLVRHDVLV
jgi:hypothetical protein